MYTANNTYFEPNMKLNDDGCANHPPVGRQGLGNVLSTISAKPILVDSSQNGMVDYRKADITSVSDYYPFGSLMPERHWQSGGYRFGFNTQERDDEIYGLGNSYTAEFWQYDARLGRRWNLDPVVKPWESGYATFNNSPMRIADPSGLDGIATVNKEKKHVDVNVTIHYSKENLKEGLLEAYLLTLNDLEADLKEHYAGEHSVMIGDEKWTVNFKFDFIPHDTDAERDAATETDIYSNKLIVTDNILNPGQWSGFQRAISYNPGGAFGRGSTMSHEGAHLLGLPDDRSYDGAEKGPVNSYAKFRVVDENVVYSILHKVINTAMQSDKNEVRVWIPGSQRVRNVETGVERNIEREPKIID